jgi:thymidine kinase
VELEEMSEFKNADLIVCDEAQFFPDLHDHFKRWCDEKSYVISSLDGDANREKFGQVLDCIPLCDKVYKLHALCEICADGTPAIFTKVNKLKKTQVLVDSIGGTTYSSVCRECYNK